MKETQYYRRKIVIDLIRDILIAILIIVSVISWMY